jgi:hypothetical protein
VFLGRGRYQLSRSWPDSISDQGSGMATYDYLSAKRALVRFAKKGISVKSLTTVELKKYLYNVITAYGHAWCMDVASERRKMTRLVSNMFTNVWKQLHLQ